MHHTSLDEIREAFLDEMRDLGYTDEQFEIMVGAGGGDMPTMAQTLVGMNVDVIMAITTPSAQSAYTQVEAAGADIPIVFSAVSNPVNAGLVERLDLTDGNITGTSDALDVEAVFALARQLTPEALTFGLVYSFEPNAISIMDEIKAYINANPGFSYLEASVTSTADVQDAALSLVGQVDAFMVATDNTVAAAMSVFAQVAIDAGIPIYTGADSMVRDGGFATAGIDYTILGAETARLVHRVLEGTAISELPVVVMYEVQPPTPIVNADTAAALGIDISDFQGIVYGG
jgi:putative ABC transport system substrate-binding protein